ncbi:protein kinase [Streptomyces europaeiscabiei]|uniref:protein kinase domain-containing protein n=1 Tax=Streptomyces europaeiscabiei TaxID=146819 RepID=UPI0029A32062|nr:protein kinase [Streptomyces europaeiscabiei]MDX3582397.1 protein kinase [Streptomyces europaeiscabiei]MDX3630538.1 protein kinase [Streptomyces europaeiscabiei]MDX3648675.1 protein kinase [Streptomyces europaeiscabiei]WUD30812.1 protein kinase [Streptomyces europaeiscabiei]
MPPSSTADRAPALRQAGALPLRPGDPDRIGPYVSLGLLGSGGMGRVYLARPADGKPDLVAVKVIRPEYAEDIRFRRRFEQEAAVHSRVRTPRMPRLAGTGFRDELLWMATEYLPGLDLAVAVDEDGPLPAVAVRRLVAELGQALADLSAAGIVHRDLKPSNVLLSAQGAHVIDFGIAKAADASAITGTGNRVGTPAYMSPEYLRTGECDTASDVFSLACTLVFAATGSAPFGDGTGVDVMHRVAFEEPNPDVLAEIATTDAKLASLLSACLAKEPGQRPTPGQLIEAVASGSPGSEAAGHDFPGSEAAVPYGTFDWPEPLGGRVLARQRACETLRRVPLEQPGPEPLGKAAGAAAADVAPSPSADVSAPPSRPTPRGTRPRNRRKRVLIGAAGLAMCMAVAGGVALTLLSPATTTASPQGGTTVSADALPGDAASASATARSDRTDTTPDGGSGTSEVSGKDERASADGDTPRPDSSASGTDSGTDEDPDTGSSAPAPGTSAPPETTPTPSDAPTEPTTPAWLTDCTYYYGNGRTRLGDSGQRVLQVQCMLSKRGYGLGGGGVDGEFDDGTKAAVQSFQQDKGLLVTDGVVRPRVWKALRSTE